MSKVATFQPDVCNISLYGDGYAWAVELRIAALGDLTGATFTAKFKSETGAKSNMTITTTPEGLLDSRFTVGLGTTTPGYFRIAVQKPGGLARSYVIGEVWVRKDLTA